jgi:hypothetical protein
MPSKPLRTVVTFDGLRKILAAFLLASAVGSACGLRPGGLDAVEATEGPQETETQAPVMTTPPPGVTAAAPAQVVDSETLTYCFTFPEGFTQQPYGSQVEVMGMLAANASHAGVVWIDAMEAGGRTAEDVANEEVAAFGGSPPRSTVLLGGEEALVLSGMPGQDPIRKVYIVHEGWLYTLSFTPERSDIEIARTQMEILFSSLTETWVWKPAGAPCPLVQ